MVMPDSELDDDKSELYRESADALRRLAGNIRFDFNRREQLLRLAEAFDRFAERAEQSK